MGLSDDENSLSDSDTHSLQLNQQQQQQKSLINNLQSQFINNLNSQPIHNQQSQRQSKNLLQMMVNKKQSQNINPTFNKSFDQQILIQQTVQQKQQKTQQQSNIQLNIIKNQQKSSQIINIKIPTQKSISNLQSTKPKTRFKRFNLQQNQQQPVLFKPHLKIKPKLGTGQLPPQSTLLLTTWNVNGIRFSIYKNHLSYYINHTKPDILCLTQTKMDQFSFNKQPITVFGFNGYWNFCKCSLGYSGVVVFSKFQPIRVIQGIREKFFMDKNKQDIAIQDQDYGDDFDKEGRVLTLEFKQFYLVTVYTPAAGRQLQRLNYKCKQFQPRFFSFCQYLMTKKQVIIAGDLNTALTQLDTHMTKNTKKGPAFTLMQRQSLQSFINKNNLIDTYRFKNPTKKQFTWWHIKYFGRQYAIGKRIDYFLLTEGFKKAIINSQIKQKFKGSDHSPLQLRLDLKKLQFKQQLK